MKRCYCEMVSSLNFDTHLNTLQRPICIKNDRLFSSKLNQMNCSNWTPSDNTKVYRFCLYVSNAKIPPCAQKQHLQ